MKPVKKRYKIQPIDEDTYSIADTDLNSMPVYLYLLIGQKKALLIDSGYGGLDLPGIISSVTDKEVICACTHGHIDHALGAYQFENAYLHSKDFELYREHSRPERIRSYGISGISALLPNPKARRPDYLALVEHIAAIQRRDLAPLESIDAFDLGNRTVTWCALPGHTQGSVVYLDEKTHTVFDSDAAPVGAFLFLPESSPLEIYRENLIDYKAYLEEHAVTRRYVGHSFKPLGIAPVQNLIDCCELVLKGKRKGFPVSTAFGNARLVSAKSALLFIR